MTEPRSFLERVADGLPFGTVERAEVVEELQRHIDDATDELEREGVPRDRAQQLALGRLGQPEELARALTAARRSRRRLLEAAGVGSWVMVKSGIYGWFVGLILAALAGVAAIAVVQVMRPLTGWALPTTPGRGFDPVSFMAIGVALYSAGSGTVLVISERAGYGVKAARRVLAVAGSLVVGFIALAVWSGPIDAVGVVALVTLPAWWLAGTARRSRLGRAAPRTIGALFLVSLSVIVASQLAHLQLGTNQPSSPASGVGSSDLGFTRIGAPPPGGVAAVVTGTGNVSAAGSSGVAYQALMVSLVEPGLLAGWQGLRVEAWRALDPEGFSPTPVSPSAVRPFAVAPAVWSPAGEMPGGDLRWSGSEPWGPDAMTLSGAVQLDRTPWVYAAWVALTGVSPDGVRHLIIDPEYVPVMFNGTAFDWLRAALSGETDR